MSISDFCGYFVFHSFQDFVDWFTSYIPFVLLVVFILNVVFSIVSYFIHLGGK